MLRRIRQCELLHISCRWPALNWFPNLRLLNAGEGLCGPMRTLRPAKEDHTRGGTRVQSVDGPRLRVVPRDHSGEHLRLLQDEELGRSRGGRDRGRRAQGIRPTVMTDQNTAAHYFGWPASWPQLVRLDPSFGSRQHSSRPGKSRARRAGPSLGTIHDATLLATSRRTAAGGQAPAAVLGLQSGSDLPDQRGAVPADSDASGRKPPQFERRFRAVLVADVVGYTRLMEAAELETHARYRTLRVGVGDPTIASHLGEIVNNTGDGFIAVF